MGVKMQYADPVLTALLNAPEDDEPETEYERQAVADAMADLEAGRMVSSEEILNDIIRHSCESRNPLSHND